MEILLDLILSCIINIPMPYISSNKLAVGFENNLKTNSERKLNKYMALVLSLSSSYQKVKFVNVSISTLGALDSSWDSFMELLEDLDFPEKLCKRLMSKIMNIAIGCMFYIFCRCNKDWTDSNLMDF